MAVRYFSAVPNRSLGPAPRFEESPFGPNDKGVGFAALHEMQKHQLIAALDCGIFQNHHGLQGPRGRLVCAVAATPVQSEGKATVQFASVMVALIKRDRSPLTSP